MPKYKVTGGESGLSGVTIGNDRYEPGETLDYPAKRVQWLVDQGYVDPVVKAATSDGED